MIRHCPPRPLLGADKEEKVPFSHSRSFFFSEKVSSVAVRSQSECIGDDDDGSGGRQSCETFFGWGGVGGECSKANATLRQELRAVNLRARRFGAIVPNLATLALAERKRGGRGEGGIPRIPGIDVEIVP